MFQKVQLIKRKRNCVELYPCECSDAKGLTLRNDFTYYVCKSRSIAVELAKGEVDVSIAPSSFCQTRYIKTTCSHRS